MRWAVEGLRFAVDAYVLGGNRTLVAEHNGNRVTERDLKGSIVLVASRGGRSVTELDRSGRTVWQFRSDLPVFRARRR